MRAIKFKQLISMDPTNEMIDCNGKNHRTPMYRGVRRRRWGNWVSEIREPGKKKKIWLGSYAMPEMAARAYDVAAVSLKGKGALPNFPHLINWLPRPASLHPRDIQIAAKEAAFSFTDSSSSTTTLESVDDSDHSASPNAVGGGDGSNKDSFNSTNADKEDTHSSFTSLSRIRTERKCFDEELYQFDSPNLVVSMAEAPLLTPPRLDGVSGYDNSYVDGDSYTELENLGFLWKDF